MGGAVAVDAVGVRGRGCVGGFEVFDDLLEGFGFGWVFVEGFDVCEDGGDTFLECLEEVCPCAFFEVVACRKETTLLEHV